MEDNMRHKKLFTSVILMLVLGLSGVYAQSGIPATGGNATGAGGSVSYSIGLVLYQTNISSGGSVTQGVQHPYEIYVYTAIEQADDINLSLSTYPNPATNYLMLEVNDYDKSNLMYQLYDAQGKMIQNGGITDNITRIDMNSMATAVYFLKVFDNNKEIKTFKIIKN
jgi:hypothetical protein